jgi:hypothetical protein
MDFIIPLIGMLICTGLLAFWYIKRPTGPLARHTVVRARIRQEVQKEFESALQKSSGIQKWLLLAKREREISRRAAQVIHV